MNDQPFVEYTEQVTASKLFKSHFYSLVNSRLFWISFVLVTFIYIIAMVELSVFVSRQLISFFFFGFCVFFIGRAIIILSESLKDYMHNGMISTFIINSTGIELRHRYITVNYDWGSFRMITENEKSFKILIPDIDGYLIIKNCLSDTEVDKLRSIFKEAPVPLESH